MIQPDLFAPASKRWNPRYVAYSLAHGRTPEVMLDYDKKRCPGGCMGEFIIWMGQRWAEWCSLTGAIPHSYTKADHANFDAWLDAAQSPA